MGTVADCCVSSFISDIPSPRATRSEIKEEERKNALKYNLYKQGAAGYYKNFVGNPPIPSHSGHQANKSDFSQPNLFKYKTPSVCSKTAL